jgi:hypothetical protein
LDRLGAPLAGEVYPSQRWPKFALFAAFPLLLAAGWLFHDAVDRSERTIPPPSAGEAVAPPMKATKPVELDQALQQAEWLSKTYEELLKNERSRSVELEQKLATREMDSHLLEQERARTKDLKEQLATRRNDEQLLAEERQRSKDLERQLAAHQDDQQSLAQARARVKELEQQLAAIRPLPPVPSPTTSPTAANDSRNPTSIYRPPPDEMTKPQPSVRRTGPRPLPAATQPMPRLSLQASDLTYNPAGYWQVTATLISNTSRGLDVRVRCSFESGGQSAGEAELGPTSVMPGEKVSADLIGPPTTVHVDSATCRLTGQ